MANPEDMENQEQEVQNVFVSSPQPLSNDEYDQIMATMAFNSLSNEDIVNLTGISKEDPDFLEKLQKNEVATENLLAYQENFIASYLNDIDDLALDGKMNKAYSKIIELARFSDDDYSFISQTNTTALDYLEVRFKNIEEVSEQLDFLERINFINSGQEVKNPSMFCKSLTSYESNLEEEQKAKLNMLCAQTLKGSLISVQGNLIPPVVAEYKEYLERAINLSSSYDIIADSHRAIEILGPIKNTRLIKDAYKKVLNKAKKDKDNKVIYSASKKLAEFYKDEYSVIGYKTENSPQFKALLKAEKYYNDAISAYKKEHKSYNPNDLRELAHIQQVLPNNEGWISTKTKIANSLNGADKYKVLISVLPKMEKNQLEYVNMLSTKVSKGNIPVRDKFELLTLLDENVKVSVKKDEHKIALENIQKARDYINSKKPAPKKEMGR